MIPLPARAGRGTRAEPFASSARRRRRLGFAAFRRLFGSEQAIARVAKARQDIGVVVQPVVDRDGVNRNVRVLALHQVYACRRSERTSLSFRAPACFSRPSAATAECPVASIGSTTMTVRFGSDRGMLK